MRTTVITFSVISVLLTVLYFVLASQPVLAQLINVQGTLENHIKAFNPNRGIAQLQHIVMVDKMIQVGSNLVAFNPNHGDAQVITILSPSD
jgi:hypothetical protein